MLVILSSQYLNSEMSLQLGLLPPAFLPVGNKRLFELQAKISAHEKVLMTLPEDFEISHVDQAKLRDCNIEILRLAVGMSLSDAFAEALAQVPCDRPVELLFGDTLVEVDIHGPPDRVSFCSIAVDYPWSFVGVKGGKAVFASGGNNLEQNGNVVCGHFNFSDPKTLLCVMTQSSFIDALNDYSEIVGLHPVEVSDWLDFGHLATYYRSKRKILVSRHFNNIETNGETLKKTSSQVRKMRAEINWFENLPSSIQLHTPKYLGRFEKDYQVGYELEYLYKPTLSDLFVFGGLSSRSGALILRKCFDLLEKFQKIRPGKHVPEASPEYANMFFEDVFIGKTKQRFEEFCQSRDLPDDTIFTINGVTLPSLSVVLEEVLAHIPTTTQSDICFWHGDFFFGNSFFDFESMRILLVDPRGILPDGELSQYGDWRYDVGKLAHSILGRYDHIVLNQASLISDGDNCWDLKTGETPTSSALEKLFLAEVERRFGLNHGQIFALAASMFLSMLPLHSDSIERQDQLLASGLLLFTKMKGA